jgi:hypothetical protein
VPRGQGKSGFVILHEHLENLGSSISAVFLTHDLDTFSDRKTNSK